MNRFSFEHSFGKAFCSLHLLHGDKAEVGREETKTERKRKTKMKPIKKRKERNANTAAPAVLRLLASCRCWKISCDMSWSILLLLLLCAFFFVFLYCQTRKTTTKKYRNILQKRKEKQTKKHIYEISVAEVEAAAVAAAAAGAEAEYSISPETPTSVLLSPPPQRGGGGGKLNVSRGRPSALAGAENAAADGRGGRKSDEELIAPSAAFVEKKREGKEKENGKKIQLQAINKEKIIFPHVWSRAVIFLHLLKIQKRNVKYFLFLLFFLPKNVQNFMKSRKAKLNVC